MYQKFFDCDRQVAMRNYFLNNLSKLGKVKEYDKKELIDLEYERYVGIVLKGAVEQEIISSKGQEKLLYLIRPGEIIGEMVYFCGGTDAIVARAKEDTQIAILTQEVLEEELNKDPQIYRYFMHSMTRKFRIVMLQLTNTIFNDASGKIADALLRLSSTAEPNSKGIVTLNRVYTHEELANNIGCSRITVTRCLNEFLKEEIISYDNKKIVINKPEILKEYIDLIVEE